MEQLRLAFRFVLFCAFAAVVYVALVIAVPERLSKRSLRDLRVPVGRYGHSLTRLAEAGKWGPVDVLFMGSSLTYRGYDVRVFDAHGHRSFNLGSSAQTPLQTEMLAKRYLHHLAPGVVVLEVTPNSFTGDGVECSVDLLANGPIDGHAVRMALSVRHLYTLNCLIYSWGRRNLLGRELPAESVRRENDTYIPGGFVMRDMGTNRPGSFVPGPPLAERPAQLKAFERLLEHLRVEGIPFVLVNPTVTGPYYAGYPDLERFGERMRALGPYVDMNTVLKLDDSLHFYDSHHLNQDGVELYCVAVIEELRAMGMLPGE